MSDTHRPIAVVMRAGAARYMQAALAKATPSFWLWNWLGMYYRGSVSLTRAEIAAMRELHRLQKGNVEEGQ